MWSILMQTLSDLIYFALHVVRETLGHFVVDIRIEQRAAHVFQRLGDINLGDFSLTFQYLK